MAIIKCGNCGKDASDKATTCVYCKSPLTAGAQSTSKSGTQPSRSSVPTQRKPQQSSGSTHSRGSSTASRSSKPAQRSGAANQRSRDADGLLISGNGMNSSAKTFWKGIYYSFAALYFLITIIIIITVVISMSAVSSVPGVPSSYYIGSYIIFAFVAIILIACGIVLLVLGTKVSKSISKTSISVYNNRVSGAGLGKAFFINSRIRQFQLSYDQITSVESTEKAVTVYASGAVFKCYAENGIHIQSAIIKQLSGRRG